MRGKYKRLSLSEISSLRRDEKAAEAVVVKRPGESQAERRAEGRGVELYREFWGADRWSEAAGRDNCGRHPGLAKV